MTRISVQDSIRKHFADNPGQDFTIDQVHAVVGGRRSAVQVAMWRMVNETKELTVSGQHGTRKRTYSTVPEAPSSTEVA